MSTTAESPRQFIERASKNKTKIASANCDGADLSGLNLAKLETDFTKLNDSKLTEASFYDARLFDSDFERAVCDRVSFESATLWQCRFRHARGEHADFHKAHAEINWFDDAVLPNANFNHAKLAHCGFLRAQLNSAEFDEARGEDIAFADAVLTNVSFRGVNFPRAVFSGAALQGADFSLADLSGADFRGAHLEGATFLGAKLEGALFDAAPPVTLPAPPHADIAACVRQYLKAGDGGDSALALYRRKRREAPAHIRSEHWIMSALSRLEGDEELDARATAMVLREVLAKDDPVLLHWACHFAGSAAQLGLVLDVAADLWRLLGAKKLVQDKGYKVITRTVSDPGLRAALALGYLRQTDLLRAGLSAKGVVPERCAGGLIVALSFDGRTAETQELLADSRRSVMSGVVEGLTDRISSAGEAVRHEEPVWGDPKVAVEILKELAAHPDEKQAKFAQSRLRSEAPYVERLLR